MKKYILAFMIALSGLCIYIFLSGNDRQVTGIYKELLPKQEMAARFTYSLIETEAGPEYEILDENGSIYFKVTEEGYTCLEDLEDLYKSVYSQAYIEKRLKWVTQGEQPLYKEIDGKLCVAMMDSISLGYPTMVSSVEYIDENKIIFTGENEKTKRSWSVTLVRGTDDNWLIDEMEMLDDGK